MNHFLRAVKILTISEVTDSRESKFGFLLHLAGHPVPTLVSYAWMARNEARPHGYLLEFEGGGRAYASASLMGLLTSHEPAETHEPTTKLKWVGEVLMQYWTPKNAATLMGVWREIPVE